MRILMNIDVPHEPFNTYVRDGSAAQKLGRILEETRPESIYFTERDGRRGAVAVYNVDNESKIPAIAEPWFLSFSANCKFGIAMTPEDLKRAGLSELGTKWK